jgi:hypothetical protein
MALPIQTAPTYTCTLPSTGETVKYRPFLVKEQKFLLLAKDGNPDEIVQSVINLIKATTFDKIDVESLTMFDLEYLFVKIRSKSVGETQQVKLMCSNNECKYATDVAINLDEVEVGEIPDINKTFMLTDDVGVELKFPSGIKMASVEGQEIQSQYETLLINCIDKIFDSENVYNAADFSEEEIKDFVENLTLAQTEQFQSFFESIPSVHKEAQWTCESCGTENSLTLRGLNSFF